MLRPDVFASLFDTERCTRQRGLEDNDMMREQRRDMKRCHDIRTKAGYEILTKMRYTGEDDNGLR